jgi:hypothetical protein
VTFDMDTTTLTDGLSELSADLALRTKAASEITAGQVVREAQGRVKRRTGLTAEGIHYDESRDGTGWVVLAVRADTPQVPFWLEFGTRTMTKRPFLYVSAAVEQPGHDRRIADAVTDAIAASGFGD